MSEQILKDIRNIEHEAEKITSDSEKQSAEIINKANDDALNIHSQQEIDSKKTREETLSAAIAVASNLRNKELEKQKATLTELKSLASKRKEKAINLILNSLSELIGE